MSVRVAPVTSSTVVVAVDVGKVSAEFVNLYEAPVHGYY
jgi:hypothetical protein